MTASSGFKGSCDCCRKPGHKQAQCFKFLRESGGGPLPSSGAGRSSWCSLHNTHLHDNTNYRAQQQHRGNGNGSGYNHGNNNSGNGNRRHHGDDSNTGRANTAVTANGTSSPTVIAPAPASQVVTAPSTPVATPPAPFTLPPTPVTSEAAPTPYVNESPPSGIGFLFLAGYATPGPLNFTMTSDCGASSNFVDSNLIGDIESRRKDIVKLDPPATIVVAGHDTLRGVSMGTLTVRVTDAQEFLHDMLLPTMNVPGLGRHLFSGETAALKGIHTVIAKEPYLDVGQFKIFLHKDTECPTKDYLDLELAPRGNYQTEAAFQARVISGYTIPTGSALASRLLRSGAMGAVAPLATATRPLFATCRAAPSLPALQTTASAHGARLINGGTMGEASTSTGTTSFAVPTIRPGLVNATTTATPTILTPVMAAAGSEHLPPAPGASERAHRRLQPRLLQDHGDHPAVQLAQHSKAQRPQRTGRTHDHGRGPVHAKRSDNAEVSSGENGDHRGVFTQPLTKQDYRRRHVVPQGVRQTRRPVLPVDYWHPSTWGPSGTSGANFAAYPISSSPTVETATLSPLASATLHTAPATRRRRSLHQGVSTFSLGGHPLQFSSSATTRGLCFKQGRAATASEANTSQSGSWGFTTGS